MAGQGSGTAAEELANRAGEPGFGDFVAAENWADRIYVLNTDIPSGVLQGHGTANRITSTIRSSWHPTEPRVADHDALVELRHARRRASVHKVAGAIVRVGLLQELVRREEFGTLANYVDVARRGAGEATEVRPSDLTPGLHVISDEHEFSMSGHNLTIFERGNTDDGTLQRRVFTGVIGGMVELEGPLKDAAVALYGAAQQPEAGLALHPPATAQFAGSLMTIGMGRSAE